MLCKDFIMHKCIHLHTHAHIHTCTHTHMHTYTHAQGQIIENNNNLFSKKPLHQFLDMFYGLCHRLHRLTDQFLLFGFLLVETH